MNIIREYWKVRKRNLTYSCFTERKQGTQPKGCVPFLIGIVDYLTDIGVYKAFAEADVLNILKDRHPQILLEEYYQSKKAGLPMFRKNKDADI